MMVTADESGADAEFHDGTIGRSIRFAGWNVNGLRARFDRITAWIDEREPDVLALHELRCTNTATRNALGAQLTRQTGYTVLFAEHVAIAAAPSWQLSVPDDLMTDGRALATTATDQAGDQHRVISVYAPNGTKAGTTKHEAKLAWFEHFTKILDHELAAAKASNTSVIVLGDLNIARAEIDIWAPDRYRRRNLFTPAERAALQAILDLGLHDVFRETHAGSGLYTWWNQAHDSFARGRGWRLDYALTDSDSADRVQHAVVDVAERAQPGTSDHAAFWIDVNTRA